MRTAKALGHDIWMPSYWSSTYGMAQTIKIPGRGRVSVKCFRCTNKSFCSLDSQQQVFGETIQASNSPSGETSKGLLNLPRSNYSCLHRREPGLFLLLLWLRNLYTRETGTTIKYSRHYQGPQSNGNTKVKYTR
jgi:hypothetical protein